MERAADPYRDTTVIDARAPRFNQAVIGLVALLAVTIGPWWLLAVLAAQLAIGLTLGRRWCLPCVAYYELVQPRFGEGPLEDARPPRFANLVGALFLSGATVAFLAGWDTAGTALGSIVAALALRRLGHGPVRRLRGVQARLPAHRADVRVLPAAPAAGAELAVAVATRSADRAPAAPWP